MNRSIFISPSTLSFLAEECRRCHYLEAHRLRQRPRTPMPTIFTKIDAAMKEHLAQNEQILDPGLPPFRIMEQDRRVTSAPIPVPGTDVDLIIRGNYDSLLYFADGILGVVDWKTSRVRDDLAAKYARSLHAYAYALEHPAFGSPCLIGRLGLGVFEPLGFKTTSENAHLVGSLSWLPIQRDDATFIAYLEDVGRILAQPEAPRASASCPFCSYHEAA